MSRALKFRRTSGLIVIFAGVVGAAVIYTDDASNLLHAIAWLLASAVAGVYIFAFAFS